MIYLAATILLLINTLIEVVLYLKGRNSRINIILILSSGILLLIELILRSVKIGFPAITNTFEALIFFSFSILIILAVLKFKGITSSVLSFGVSIVALILLLISSSPIIPKDLNPPIPALQSNWLILHVSFSFIGQSFFAVSFIAAICSLLSRSNKERYRSLTIKSIIIGYPIYTSGAIIFGSIWASSAWGSFWSWDNKEIWALVTCFIYTIILHGRLTKYIKGNKIALLSIIGFLVSLFTFLGVNYLLPSLHSYS